MLFEMDPQPSAEELTALEYNAGECDCRKKAADLTRQRSALRLLHAIHVTMLIHNPGDNPWSNSARSAELFRAQRDNSAPFCLPA